ncbi:metal ABC transporter ATP-binding protein [Clostridium magnum]|uniref:High-affinity zinc uptake system ATP-binding protein ZnuC n=1 Tax=Clostridium magnum DSM 2767 TaxID=1121326 RepID=A0A161WGJ7_9CLOT|nr:metal ABC transporter ATP-binding protein [Clostridium magnum]KZL90805.1 high-affinity zinc uptake system ATP-binding protein ZnuC [Clostridium magnum DSM 2767]SHI11690.1 zinc transport system ATP-binding protein [Clostridium magnum DSM 2767]
MIQIRNLIFSYTGNTPYILDKINLNIMERSYVSILGENGSAKTTLVKLILNLLKPLSGIITLDTEKIGYVPQRVENFNSQFPITVSEMLKCHMKVLKLKNSRSILNSLEAVGMENFKNTLIGDMSGGQQQKIFIARALMGNPKLLILDEPSTGIDIQSQQEIYSIIKHLNLHLGITVLAVEHNLKAALDNSTHICLMENGSATLYPIDEYKEML